MNDLYNIVLTSSKELEQKYINYYKKEITKVINVSIDIGDHISFKDLEKEVKKIINEKNLSLSDINISTNVEVDSSEVFQWSSLVISYPKEEIIDWNEKQKKIEHSFNLNLYRKVFKELTASGFKKVPFPPSKIKDFSKRDFNLYKEFQKRSDKFFEYFQIMFEKCNA